MPDAPTRLGLSGADPSARPPDPETTRERGRPWAGVVAGFLGGAAPGASLALLVAVATGVEPFPILLPLLATIGAIAGLAVARRSWRHDPPTLAHAFQHGFALVAIALAVAVVLQVVYLFWIRGTSRELAEKEWNVLAGMTAADVVREMGEPTRREPAAGGAERWIYEKRFGRLPRFRVRLDFEGGRFRRSLVDTPTQVRLVWSAPPPAGDR